jgi:hypothetical protein
MSIIRDALDAAFVLSGVAEQVNKDIHHFLETAPVVAPKFHASMIALNESNQKMIETIRSDLKSVIENR